MMKLIEDLGMLFATEKSKKKSRFGIYECPTCKKHFKTATTKVKIGKTKGCKNCGMSSHFLSNHKLYNTWRAEKERCNYVNHIAYSNYGGRGISISKEFEYFPNWLMYVESLENCYADGFTIDRINNNGNYERGNLRWVSRSVQASNTRKLQKNNTSFYRGVSFYKITNRWRARIAIENKTKYLGYYSTAKEAALVYDKYIDDNNLHHTKNF